MGAFDTQPPTPDEAQLSDLLRDWERTVHEAEQRWKHARAETRACVEVLNAAARDEGAELRLLTEARMAREAVARAVADLKRSSHDAAARKAAYEKNLSRKRAEARPSTWGEGRSETDSKGIEVPPAQPKGRTPLPRPRPTSATQARRVHLTPNDLTRLTPVRYAPLASREDRERSGSRDTRRDETEGQAGRGLSDGESSAPTDHPGYADRPRYNEFGERIGAPWRFRPLRSNVERILRKHGTPMGLTFIRRELGVPEDKSEESSVATWFIDETRRADSWIERTAHGVYGLTEWRKARRPPDTET